MPGLPVPRPRCPGHGEVDWPKVHEAVRGSVLDSPENVREIAKVAGFGVAVLTATIPPGGEFRFPSVFAVAGVGGLQLG